MNKQKKEKPPFIFGKNPYCNRKAERAPRIGEFCLPLCWRCLGGVLGITLASVGYGFGVFQAKWSAQMLGICLLLFLPAFFHYLANKVFDRDTKNTMRFLTGIALGISIEIPVLCLLNTL